jgi:hypothetical protein
VTHKLYAFNVCARENGFDVCVKFSLDGAPYPSREKYFVFHSAEGVADLFFQAASNPKPILDGTYSLKEFHKPEGEWR